MSLSINGSKFVRVYDTEIKLQVSDKIVFAHLSTSRKTGKEQVDAGTGEILLAGDGSPLPERRRSSWNAAVPHGTPGLLAMPLSRQKDLHRVRLSISLTDGLPMNLTRKRMAVRAMPLLPPFLNLRFQT